MLKTISSITNALGALNYKGTWNASTNTPTLTSSVGAKGDYYVVSVAGSTNLNGETLWGVGDWAVFNGSVWQRVEGGDTINATTVSASTSVSTPVIQALSSAGGTIKNNGGTNQMQWGSGGGNNLSLEVATNINPANAAVNISPTGTGTVTINPATASTMNNVAIGGTTPLAGSFTTLGATSTASATKFIPTGGGATGNGMYLPATNEVAISTNGVERLRYLSDGTILAGTTDSGFFGGSSVGVGFFATNGFVAASRGGAPSAIFNRYTDDGEVVQFRRSGNTVGSVNVTTLATTYTSISDYRLKNNPQPLVDSGAFIDSLQPKTWQWSIDGSNGVGFIAHEVQAVSPTTVTGARDAQDKEGNPQYQSMEYGSAEFIANIIAELKSLRLRVAALEAK